MGKDLGEDGKKKPIDVVWHDQAPGGDEQRDAARLADRHRRAHVRLEKHAFDGDDVRIELADERLELSVQRGEPIRDGEGGIARDHAGCDGELLAVLLGDPAEAAARQAGVDTEDKHTFDSIEGSHPGGGCATGQLSSRESRISSGMSKLAATS